MASNIYGQPEVIFLENTILKYLSNGPYLLKLLRNNVSSSNRIDWISALIGYQFSLSSLYIDQSTCYVLSIHVLEIVFWRLHVICGKNLERVIDRVVVKLS